MSDNEGKAGAWTEAAKFQFLLRIVAQLKEESGRSISWTKLNMPGRTTKSLQNMWTKIQKDIAALETGGDGDAAGTPKKAAPRKKKAVDDEDDGAGTPSKPTPKKRAAGSSNTSTKRAKKPKKEESDEDEAVKEEDD